MNRFIIYIALTCLLIVTGCSNKNEVALEIRDYHNEHWLQIQQMKVTGIDILKNQVYPDETQSDVSDLNIDQALAMMSEVIKYLESIEPAAKDVQQLHDYLVEAEKFSLVALNDQTDYLNGDIDAAQVEESHKELTEKFNTFTIYRDHLMEEYKIGWGDETDIPGAREMVTKND